MIMTVAGSYCQGHPIAVNLTKKGVSANCASDNEDFGWHGNDINITMIPTRIWQWQHNENSVLIWSLTFISPLQSKDCLTSEFIYTWWALSNLSIPYQALKMTMVTMQVNDNFGEAKFVSSIEEKKQEQYCNSLECISDGIQIWMFFRCVRESALAAAIKHLPEGWGLSQYLNLSTVYNIIFLLLQG